MKSMLTCIWKNLNDVTTYTPLYVQTLNSNKVHINRCVIPKFPIEEANNEPRPYENFISNYGLKKEKKMEYGLPNCHHKWSLGLSKDPLVSSKRI
jgi:hypothetical protein